jgi:hypothetical protein
MGWDYAIQWLTILPFEITAAGITIDYWKHYNIGVRSPFVIQKACLTFASGLDSCLPHHPYRDSILWRSWLRRSRIRP